LGDNFSLFEMQFAMSLRSALVALDEHSFDLIVLDMTLPNFDQGVDEDGGVIHARGGQEFLRKMKRRKMTIPVIVLTQFESFGSGSERVDLGSLREVLAAKYSGICAATIHYDSAVDAWKKQLRVEIAKILGEDK
jgi:CheY-like chemotaxis protein